MITSEQETINHYFVCLSKLFLADTVIIMMSITVYIFCVIHTESYSIPQFFSNFSLMPTCTVIVSSGFNERHSLTSKHMKGSNERLFNMAQQSDFRGKPLCQRQLNNSSCLFVCLFSFVVIVVVLVLVFHRLTIV